MADPTDTIVVVDPQGNPRELSVEAAASALDQPGWRVQTDSDRRERLAGEAREETYGGTSGKIAAGAAGFARGATLGLSDVVIDQLGGAEDLRQLREVNPISSTVGEVGGGVASSFAAPGSLLARGPAGIVARTGSSIAKVGEGAGFIRSVGRAAAGAGTEGVFTGAGQAVSELALSDDPLTFERASSAFSSNVLYSGSVGAGAGLVTKVIGSGLLKAKGAIDDLAARRASASSGEVADDLSSLGAKELRAAELAERESLSAAQVTERSAAVDELTAYRKTVKEANPWLVITEGEPSAQLTSTSKALRNAMNDPVGLAKNPATALKSLRIQEQALTKAISETDTIAASLAATNKKLAKELGEELATLPDHLDEVTLTGKHARRYGSYTGAKVPKGGSVTLKRDDAAQFLDALDSGAVQGSEAIALKKLPDLLDANQALQRRIEAASIPKADLASPRLTQIADARDALTTGGAKKGIGEQMLGGAAYSGAASVASMIPVIGPMIAPFVGAKAAGLVGERVFGRLAQASTNAAARTASAVSSFFNVAGKAAPAVPVLATKVLSSVSFAPPQHTETTRPQTARPRRDDESESNSLLAQLYRARSEEIRSQVSYLSGAPVMNESARREMADRLDPLREIAPILADRIETLAARRMEFLASKMPRRPEFAGMSIGPDNWQPSDMEMRTWARYVAAVEDPGGIEERLATATVTPEDAEVMREVYPERFAEMKRQIAEKLPTLQATLPFARRLAMSIFTGIPVDPSMDPRILRVLQGSFVGEPGTDGGLHAPKSVPQFGSVSRKLIKLEGTPSQNRAGLS